MQGRLKAFACKPLCVLKSQLMKENNKHEIIVALDVPDFANARSAVSELGDAVSFYKVGLELFISDGPAVLDMLRGEGKRIFLDLKLHDIPRTVERAVKSCVRYGVELLTIHAFGSVAMIEAAANAAQEADSNTRILAVTMLTSLDKSDMDKLGINGTMEERVVALGALAVGAGAGGLVCSPQEVLSLRKAVGKEPWLITPGVRPLGDGLGDQKRVATPAQAIRDGATHLVIGRPIMEAADKRKAALAIRAEMDA
jgi:orotidine-5'-phosphate decarboxylase